MLAGKCTALTAALCLVVATTLAYLTSFGGALVFDDIPGIANNPTIRDLRRPDLLLVAIGPQGGTLSGRPVPNFTLALNYAISGLDLWSYHAANLLIHMLAGLALFGLVRRTLLRPVMAERFRGPALPLALLIALIWSLHPLQTESVTYLVQRVESLMGLFFLLTLYCFVRAVDSPHPRRWFVASFFTCLLGMGSKEVMVAAPLLVLVYDRMFVAESWRDTWHRRRWFHAALFGTWLLLGWLVLESGGRGGTAGFGTQTPWWHYALTQCEVVLEYLRLSLWPHPLVFDHHLPLATGLAQVWPHAFALLLLVGAVVWLLFARPKAGFLGLCFFAILAPTSSVVPIVTQTMAEHRMYLPLAAVVTAVVLGLHGWIGRAAIPVGTAVALVLGVATAFRNLDYASPLALWSDVAAKMPRNPRAHNSIGAYLFAAGRFDEARDRFAAAVRLDPKFASAHFNNGRLLEKTGQLPEAISSYETALRLDPKLGDAHVNLGLLLDRVGRPAEAAPHFEAALGVEPDAAEVHAYLGLALLKLKRIPSAVEHLETATRLEPENAGTWCDLARAYQQKNDVASARRALEQALRLQPAFPLALYLLGNVHAAAGEFSDAVTHYQRALSAAPDYVAARNNLANALVMTGNLTEAIAHYRQILQQRPGDREVQENLSRALEMQKQR